MKKNLVRKTVITGSASLALLAALGMGVMAGEAIPEDAGVFVEENENSKTGYTATFKYYNEDAAKVQIKGGFQFYYDEDEKVSCNLPDAVYGPVPAGRLRRRLRQGPDYAACGYRQRGGHRYRQRKSL